MEGVNCEQFLWRVEVYFPIVYDCYHASYIHTYMYVCIQNADMILDCIAVVRP